MKTWKKITLGFLFFIALLAGVLVYRTITFEPPTQKTTKITAQSAIPPVDKKSAVQHLSKAITFKTIASLDDNKVNADQFVALHQFLRATYPNVFSTLKVKDFPPYGLLLVWEGSDPTLKPMLLMSHQDVVPIAKGTEQDWEQPPFSGNVSDGYIWGRGTIDVKSGVIGILEAVNSLINANVQPKRTVYLFFGDNEEIGGPTAERAGKYFKENGREFSFVLDEGSGIIRDGIQSIKEPIAYISVAEKGYVDLMLSTKARGGHSSMPPALTAIGRLSRAISRLQVRPFPAHITKVNVEMMNTIAPQLSFFKRLIIANLWFFKPAIERNLGRNQLTNALLRTTIAPTIFNAGVKENVLPIKASANINLRIIPGDTVKYVKEHVKKSIDDDQVIVSIPGHAMNPSPISSTNSDAYRSIVSAIKTVYDGRPILTVPFLTVGATDSKYFVPVADNVYRFLCCEIDMSDVERVHGTNERLSIKNLMQMIEFYEVMILNARHPSIHYLSRAGS